MKSVLIIGSGGREHAIARSFSESMTVETVYVAPGNPGMLSNAKIECVNIQVTEIELLIEFAQINHIDLTFVGPEQPLELGIVDSFMEHNLAIVGPTKSAAQLENSKNFAKDIMKQVDVKTAQYKFFEPKSYSSAKEYAQTLGLPFVIKADGLMSGKGVVIPETMDEALTTLKDMMETNNKPVLIEEFLIGSEFSHFSLINGTHVIPLGTSCDYKRVADGDQGLNTGGMGAFAPVPWFNEVEQKIVQSEIVQPIADRIVEIGTPFTGVLYTGIIWTADGPKVIEFNTRLGDPETQVLLPLLENDIYDVMEAHLNHSPIDIKFKNEFNVGVVLAATGYPTTPMNHIPLDIADDLTEHILFAGITESPDSGLLSKGGRILIGLGNGQSLEEAKINAYKVMKNLDIKDTFYREDIGLNRSNQYLEEVQEWQKK